MTAPYLFPQSASVGDLSVTEGGATLHDFFCGCAMIGLLADRGPIKHTGYTSELCKLASDMADMMVVMRTEKEAESNVRNSERKEEGA